MQDLEDYLLRISSFKIGHWLLKSMDVREIL